MLNVLLSLLPLPFEQFIHYFLSNRVQQDWKDRNIRAIIGVAGAWGGHFKALYKFYGNENDEPINMLFPRVVPVERTFSSLPFLFPRPNVWKNHVLVRTEKRMYTTNDYEELFKDMNNYELLEKYRDAKAAWGPSFDHPGTDLHCISGVGFGVTESVAFRGDAFQGGLFPGLIYGPGDGHLHLKSMAGCKLFKELRPDKLFSYQEVKATHMALFQEKEAIDAIIDIIDRME